MSEISHAKLQVFTNEEVERRVAAGADRASFGVSDEELETSLRHLQERLKEEYPEGDVSMADVIGQRQEEIEAANRSLRMTWLCRKLFLPDNPDEFPPVTVEALRTQPAGDQLLLHYRETYARMQEDPVANAKTAYDLEFNDTIVQQILEYVERTARIEYRPAEGVLFRINGVDIKVDDIWAKLVPSLSETDVRMAKQWIANTTLLREALQKAGAWLSDEEAEAAYKAYSDPYRESIFSCERIALMVKRFPSVEAYKEYRRLLDSFQRLKTPEMTKEVLKQHQDAHTSKLLGHVSVDVDVILCSAFDIKGQRMKENGWQEAELRMKDVLRLLVEEERPWEDLLERYTEFYEFPTPVSMREQKHPERRLKGRFRGYERNNLLSELGENDYLLFLNGSSITDFIFFEQEVGMLGDPMKGPMGWYLPLLLERSEPPQRLPVDEADLAEMVKDDYLVYNLSKYAHQLVKESGVYGL